MIDNEILADLKNKSFYKTAEIIRNLTEIEQFNLNGQWTDYLQTLIDYGNMFLLKGFRYPLIMEDV
jgi:hypothetical protein